jgi:hypothetical protein
MKTDGRFRKLFNTSIFMDFPSQLLIWNTKYQDARYNVQILQSDCIPGSKVLLLKGKYAGSVGEIVEKQQNLFTIQILVRDILLFSKLSYTN